MVEQATATLTLFKATHKDTKMRDQGLTCPLKASMMNCRDWGCTHSMHFCTTWLPFWSFTHLRTWPSNSRTISFYWGEKDKQKAPAGLTAEKCKACTAEWGHEYEWDEGCTHGFPTGSSPRVEVQLAGLQKPPRLWRMEDKALLSLNVSVLLWAFKSHDPQWYCSSSIPSSAPLQEKELSNAQTSWTSLCVSFMCD